MWKSCMKNEFRIWSNGQRFAVALIIALFCSSFFGGETAQAKKSNDQIAKELLYGNWARPLATRITYEFNENNIKIIRVSDVNPKGESTIAVSLKKPDGSWTTNNIVCYISLEKNQYRMYLVRRNERGNEIQGNDAGVKYKKVYWKTTN